jgi:thiamine kinase-like enzyme
MQVTIEKVVKQITDWQAHQVHVEPLTGGLTNTNYRVVVDGKPFIVRIPGASTELLAVDRQNEIYNSKAAAEAGVGPKVLYELPEYSVMVLEFISGQTMSIESLQAPGMPARIARSLRMLHGGNRFLKDFDMFRLVEFYLSIVDEHQVRIPDDYGRYLPVVNRIEAAVRAAALPTVPCNNDLLAENYIDDGQLLRLIDFEYSGNNDPCFELGNTCQELQYSDTQYAELCSAYFGTEDPAQLARMHLFALMSDVGWTLWGAIQNKISKLDFDFWDYTMTRWNRAREVLTASRLEAWLAEAQRAN